MVRRGEVVVALGMADEVDGWGHWGERSCYWVRGVSRGCETYFSVRF